MKLVIEFPDSEFKDIIRNSLKEHELQKAKGDTVTLFSVNQVAKRLGMAHATIKRLIASGIIKATKDNKITEQAINEYLQTA